ncbi:unnamed protein product [Chrysodeixis includens]|uniref:p53 DNA-binding domain-containing protein n=1 Tax=Chrysodeixis includens TaxID=689277 RepID=A0A9P0BTX3_CHRIL|nr:unnamed protein product [Chrysodeixis includens]
MNDTKLYVEDYGIGDGTQLFDMDILSEIPSFIPSPESETMDIARHANVEVQFPYSPVGPPKRNSYPGELNFTVEVNSHDVHKKTFLYSHMLSRIYVDMKCNFSIQFNWDYRISPHMYVRSTVVFSDEPQAEKRVERCVQHCYESSKAGIKPEIAKNVLHSSREMDAQGVYYCGDVDVADSWYSVLVEFHRTSDEPCSHAYQFTCKNSCASGINRRAIAIIFTLEDEYGRVYGRQKVGARVCACPRRDLLKDETAEGKYKTGKKRVPSNEIDPPKTKKIKMEAVTDIDDTVYKLPSLQVVGSRAMLSGLKVMLEMMELAAECRKNNPAALALYQPHIARFKETIQTLEMTRNTTQ